MTEFHRQSADDPPEYDIPPPPVEDEQGQPLPIEGPPAMAPVPNPTFAPPPAQPQFLGYTAQGQPIYGFPARPPMNPMMKTAIAAIAGVAAVMLVQSVTKKRG